MDLLLTGTGPATGFPAPGCPCAVCASSSRPGSAGPPPRRPAQLQLRAGSQPGWRLDVDCRLHEPDGSSHQLRTGDDLHFPGFGVRAFGGDPTRLTLLVRSDRSDGGGGGSARPWGPLLWAPQAGRPSSAVLDGLAGALAGTGLESVMLGPVPEADPADPLDDQPALVDCALALARLRSIAAVTERTECLLIGVGHRQGDPDRLAACLAHWGARIPADGTWLEGSHRAPIGGRTLVLGGAASGKSGLAEHLLAAEPEVLYTATGPVVDLRSRPDAEWAERVSRHRERRPAWWRTEETHEVATLLAKAEQPVLLDSIGTWLAGVLDRSGAWQDQEGWRRRLAADTDLLVRAWRARRAPLVAVSDEVGWGVVPATASGRLFRDELGRLNRRLADESERVLVVVAGRVLTSDRGPIPGPGRSADTGMHVARGEPQ